MSTQSKAISSAEQGRVLTGLYEDDLGRAVEATDEVGCGRIARVVLPEGRPKVA